MRKVYVDGSNSIKFFSKRMQSGLAELIEQGDEILLGDSRWFSLRAQHFYKNSAYSRVLIYTEDPEPDHNVGKWEVHQTASSKKTSFISERWFGTPKIERDKQRALDADEGFFIWDGESREVFLGLLMLLNLGKPARVLSVKGSVCIESQINELDDMFKITPYLNARRWTMNDEMLNDESRDIVEHFIPSKEVSGYLASCPLSKRQLVAIILGSPLPLEDKRTACANSLMHDDIFNEVVEELARRNEEKSRELDSQFLVNQVWACWNAVVTSSFSPYCYLLDDALASLPKDSEPNTPAACDKFVYRKDFWDEQPDLYEEHEAGVGPYRGISSALESLRWEIQYERWDADSPCWTAFENWYFNPLNRGWENRYTFWAIEDQLVFLDENHFDEDLQCWSPCGQTSLLGGYWRGCNGLLNLKLPFQVGDIVLFDCRPFAPLARGLVIKVGTEGYSSGTYVLARRYGNPAHCVEEAPWCTCPIESGGLHVSAPGYSPFYRMMKWDYDLPVHERVLKEVQEWLGHDADKGERLDEALLAGLNDATDDMLRAFIRERS